MPVCVALHGSMRPRTLAVRKREVVFHRPASSAPPSSCDSAPARAFARFRGGLVPEHCGRGHALLLDEIVSERKRGPKILAAMLRAFLRKVGNGFRGEVCVVDQLSEGHE